MRILIFLLAVSAAGQTVGRRIPAGVDAEGNTLTVIERRGTPKRYLLEKSRQGKVLASDPVVVLRPDPSGRVENEVTVGANRLTLSRDGGISAGFYAHQEYRLSPWMPLSFDGCTMMGSGESTSEAWDWRTMRGQAWHVAAEDSDAGICVRSAKLPSWLVVPRVAFDAGRLEQERDRLGSCGLTLDASGKNGWVTWGKADAEDRLEVKLLRTGKQTLMVQVVDPSHVARPASSWIFADHLELWMGSSNAELSEEVWQFGIPLEDGPVEVGYGKPKQLPMVRRWAVKLADGRAGTMLRIELPPQPADWASGFTVVYSQGDGKVQRRQVATSRVKRGRVETLGSESSILDRNEADRHVVCEVRGGALEMVGPRVRVLEVLDGALGR